MNLENKEDILQLLGGTESVEVEFKSAKGGLPEVSGKHSQHLPIRMAV